jgi:hypothetical protein
MSNPLVQYVFTPAKQGMVELDGKMGMGKILGERVGVMVAYTDPGMPGRYLVGFSFCRKGDRFNRISGLDIALARASAWATRNKVPAFVKSRLRRKWFLAEFRKFQDRCDKYFKGLKCAWDL